MKTMTSFALAALFMAAAVPALAQADPATVIKMCDTNGDNAVTQKEWNACGAPTPYPADADKNHDGKVTLEELSASQPSGSQTPAKPH